MSFTTVIYALLAGVAPALLWLWFWLREDNLHPEPRVIIAATFITGCISVVLAILLEKIAQEVFLNPTYRYIVWAAIEEMAKLTVVVLVAFETRVVDEPIDAMIYCITAALGFAALENALFILSPLAMGELSASIVTGNLRFVGASLVHVVSSSIIGFMIAVSFYRGLVTKAVCITIGIILAVALHSGFNLAIIHSSEMTTLRVFGWVWGAAVILIILFEEVKAVRPKNQ